MHTITEKQRSVGNRTSGQGRAHVLVLMDAFSDDHVLFEYAVKLARAYQARIELYDVQLTAREMPATEGTEDTVAELRDAEKQMERHCKTVQQMWKDTTYALTTSATGGKVPSEADYWLDKIRSAKPDIVL
ncbi:MAG: hypothetical protein R3301_03165, partial [Saprospiraceae bacterium]|nr:hypothetical protein [Saprospiraceae bacterium]